MAKVPVEANVARPGDYVVEEHPNCDEILHVLRGRIEHQVDDEYVEMKAGDTISIPTG